MATGRGESNKKSNRTAKSQWFTSPNAARIFSSSPVQAQGWHPQGSDVLFRSLQYTSMQAKSRFHVTASDKQAYPAVAAKRLNIQQAVQLQQQLMAFDFPDDDEDRKVVLGICAMAKKSHSKPMNEIIRRLRDNFERLQVLVFDEDTILNKPVEEWPIVNGLVSFFSHGFPLDKAIAYKNLRNPFVVNDMEMQYVLQDRRKVYAILEENNIPHPRYAVLDRGDPNCVVSETEDSIEVNGNLFMKPFVEKPVSAEDHNIYIYFPVSAGGGSTRLFRKVKDRSSIYSRFCRVRNKGSYLYEDFMPTDGTDVKVYTVGPDYQHAEARKSPALDGKVERDPDGKEIRYPVLLNNKEKMIARSVCRVFKQNVCGFDLLRANGKHYVCDVNGFSFVKTSSKYYDDCAKILGTLVMRACCPQLHIPFPLCGAPEDIPVVQTTSGSMMELRCVIAVIRHGDRTPKQKMKMEVKNKKFFDLFEKYGGFKSGQLKLKKPKQLQEVLDIVRHLLTDSQAYADPEVEEKKAKLNQLKLVLEMYGHFSGINRKVQLKYQPNGRPQRSSSEEELSGTSPGCWCADKRFEDVESDDDEAPRDPSLVLILKWGGELTPAGRIQAENLGKAFRTLYPGGQGQFEAPGLGFLRLHSTFRHDLKIYASDEGRVQMTAAAFTKGMLALEGELTPIIVQMVKSANTNGLLDGESNTSKYHIVVKEKLKEIFNQDREFTEADFQQLAATNSISLINAMQFVKNPYQMCQRVHEMIQEITARIRCLKMELKSRDLTLFNGESWELLIRRWAKLEKDFCLKNGRFDVSKIPDIYDCIKYDLQHNQKTLQFQRAQELFMCSKALADIVIPQEYGITKDERLHIGQNYCTPLLRKIRCDLLQCINEPNLDDSTTRLDSKKMRYMQYEDENGYSNGVASPERFVRTRLYFTSESHIHSLLSMLRYGDFLDEEKDEQWKRSMDFVGACAELNYMSQIVLMMFEDPAKPEDSDERFHIELHFSPGAYTSCDQMGAEPKGMGFRPKNSRDHLSGNNMTVPEVVEEGPESGTPSSTICPEVPTEVQDTTDVTLVASNTASSEADKSQNLSVRPIVRNCVSMPDASDLDDLGELVEEDIFGHGQSSTEPEKKSHSDTAVVKKKKTAKLKYEPHSPDPNTPEWDWGDEEPKKLDKDEKKDQQTDKRAVRQIGKYSVVPAIEGVPASSKQETPQIPEIKPPSTSQQKSETDKPPSSEEDAQRQKSLPPTTDVDVNQSSDQNKLSLSLPKHVEMMLRLNDLKDYEETDYFEERKSRFPARTEPIEINVTPGDEKRSRSFEDSTSDMSPKQAAVQRNYRTIHLPLAQDTVVRPLSSFFFYSQQTPKGQEDDAYELRPAPQALCSLRSPRGLSLLGSASSPDFSRLGFGFGDLALEGFSNVPLLHPLETLHNNLTFLQVDDFLGRVTSVRFPVPDISDLGHISSKSLLTLATPTKLSEFPTSASSSGGPNSPVVPSNSVDFIKSLGLYISHQSQSEVDQATGSEGGKPDTNSSQNSTTSEDPSDLDVTAVSGSLTVTMDNPVQLSNSDEKQNFEI